MWLIVVACVVLINTMFLPVVIENFVFNLVDGPGEVLALAHGIPEASKFLLVSSGSVQTVLALWVSVPMTLCLAERLWRLSHCKYWSVCVGLQYTVMDREPSACSVIKVSRKGIAPFPWVPSIVNLIAGSTLFICSRNSCLLACCWMTQVPSTNLYIPGRLQQT